MKQKRVKSQLEDLNSELEDQPSTRAGGNLERTRKTTGKDLDCSTGVCSVTWKPDAMKR